MVLEDYLHAVNQTYEIKLRQEGFINLTLDEVKSKNKRGVLENLQSIWDEHREDDWGNFENEEITRYICEKISLGEAGFLTDKTKDQFRSLYRMIAERIRQHKDFVSKDDKDKVPKARI